MDEVLGPVEEDDSQESTERDRQDEAGKIHIDSSLIQPAAIQDEVSGWSPVLSWSRLCLWVDGMDVI